MKKLLKLVLCVSLIVLIPSFMYISPNTFTVSAQVVSLKEINPEGIPIITSDKYIISEDYKYIYTKTDVDISTILSNITVENGSVSIANNILYLSNKEKFENNIGDVNGDKEITIEDYELIFQYKSGGEVELDAEALKRADVDGDGTVTMSDALLIQKYVDTEEIITEYKIVSISSSKYDLTEDKIILADGETSFDLNNIIVINGDKEYKDNTLLIKYEEDELDSYDVETNIVTSSNEELNPGTSDISVTIILSLLVIVAIGLVSAKKKINKIK